jgi:hypothetical protein
MGIPKASVRTSSEVLACPKVYLSTSVEDQCDEWVL